MALFLQSFALWLPPPRYHCKTPHEPGLRLLWGKTLVAEPFRKGTVREQIRSTLNFQTDREAVEI